MGREEKDLTVVSRDVKSAVVISSASKVRLLVMLQEMEEEEEEEEETEDIRSQHSLYPDSQGQKKANCSQ